MLAPGHLSQLRRVCSGSAEASCMPAWLRGCSPGDLQVVSPQSNHLGQLNVAGIQANLCLQDTPPKVACTHLGVACMAHSSLTPPAYQRLLFRIIDTPWCSRRCGLCDDRSYSRARRCRRLCGASCGMRGTANGGKRSYDHLDNDRVVGIVIGKCLC